MQQSLTGVFSMPIGVEHGFTALPTTLDAYKAVKYDGTYGLALCGSTDVPLGFLVQALLAAGLGKASTGALVSPFFPGIIRGVADGLIAADADVYMGANGKVSGSGTVIVGHNVGSATTTDGDAIYFVPKTGLSSATGTTNTGTQTLTNKTLTSPVINTPIVKDTVTAKTDDYSVVAATDTGQVFTNTGAAKAITFSLPAAVVGLNFRFAVGAAYALQIDPNGSETISLPSTGVAGAAGKYLTCATVGATVEIECTVAGTWNVFGYTGTWTAQA